MFSLQQWLDTIQRLENEADELLVTSTIGSILRERMKKKATNEMTNFPFFQVILFLIAIIFLFFIIYDFSTNKLIAYSYLYTLSPSFLLIIIFITSTVFSWSKGRKKAKRIINLF